MIKEAWAWRGKIRVIATFADGSTQTDEFDNLITQYGKDVLRSTLLGLPVDGELKYVALGAGSTAPAYEDVSLEDERFRKSVTKKETISGNVITTVYISPTEANDFEIQELGWFDDTGMIARALYARQKTSLESLQIERSDIVG